MLTMHYIELFNVL